MYNKHSVNVNAESFKRNFLETCVLEVVVLFIFFNTVG